MDENYLIELIKHLINLQNSQQYYKKKNMKLTFGKEFQQLFSQVLNDIRAKTQKRQKQYPNISNILRQSRQSYIIRKQYEQNQSAQFRRSSRSSYSNTQKQFLTSTFTNLKNIRYKLEENPQNNFRVTNIMFPYAAKRIKNRIGELSKSYDNNDKYVISTRCNPRYLESKSGNKQKKISQQRKQQFIKKNRKNRHLKHTQVIEGWVNANQDSDIIQYVRKT